MDDAVDRSGDDIEARRRFLVAAQHKLRTPLTAISGWSATLQRWDDLQPEERVAGLEAIERAAEELRTQIDDVIDEARIRLLERSLRPRAVELAPFLAEHPAARRLDPERHPVEIRVPDGLEVRADPDALGHVIDRIVDNAARYSPDGGPIEISARAGDDGCVIVTIADQGMGLPGDAEVLFEPFRRGDHAAAIAPGTGLGLYVVRSLVRRMGGEVTARDRDPGTVVEVRLPLGAGS